MSQYSPLLQVQHVNSLNTCCKLSCTCIFPQPTLEKHGSCGPVLQEGFYTGKSCSCTINNSSFTIDVKDSLILPAHQSYSKIRDSMYPNPFGKMFVKNVCPSLYMTRLATGRGFFSDVEEINLYL